MRRLRSLPLPAALAAFMLCAAGCGGGSSGATGSGPGNPPAATDNVVAVVLDDGPVDTASSSTLPIGSIDTPFVSITLCAHGTTTCQRIDHITVDTGSSGLRIMASALSSSLAAALTRVADAQGRPLAECLPFADGYSWGSVRQADVRIGSEQADGLSIQVIGDPALPTVPGACSSGGATQEDTVTAFGANGLLGISAFKQDCGPACVTSTAPSVYFACPTAASCTATTVPLATQLWNPVALLPVDNNGTVLALDQVPAGGAVSSSGSLIFGIDTQGNNTIGTASVLMLDPNTGDLNVTYNNRTITGSFIDSGSNGYYFNDSTIPTCSSSFDTGFYCPSSTQNLTATMTSSTGFAKAVDFNVANTDTLYRNGNGNYWVFNDLGGTALPSGGFDFGLPFYLGRRVYTALEQSNTSVGFGPFIAF